LASLDENFQFFSGSSIRSRNLRFCSFFETWRKNFRTTTSFRVKYCSKLRISSKRSSQISFPTSFGGSFVSLETRDGIPSNLPRAKIWTTIISGDAWNVCRTGDTSESLIGVTTKRCSSSGCLTRANFVNVRQSYGGLSNAAAAEIETEREPPRPRSD